MKKFNKINEAETTEAPVKGLIDIKKGPQEVLAAAKNLPSIEILKAGKTDAAGPDDEKISITTSKSTARNLIPTQSEIGSSNSLDDQMCNRYGATEKALKGENLGPNGGAPILVFKGDKEYILDGHHRWSQFRATAPDVQINTAVISAPGVETEAEALALVHVILLALYEKSPTKPFQGDNIFKLGREGVKNYILNWKDPKDAPEGVTKEVLDMLVKAGKIKEASKEAAAEYWSLNLSSKKEDPKGIEVGKYSREFMPQPGDASKGSKYEKDPGINTLTKAPIEVESGDINYINPTESDLKKESKVIKTYEKFIQQWKK